MPLFNSDDYANLHPERDRVPSGMTDESYMVAVLMMYTSWLTNIIEGWPDSQSELETAFDGESPLWGRVTLRKEDDQPELMLLIATTSCLAELLDCIHSDTAEVLIGYLADIAKLRRDDCADASERAEVDTVFAEAYQLVRSESSGDATQVFMMRILDQAHNLEGCPDASKAVRLAASVVAASIAIVVGTPDMEARTLFVKVVQALAERVAADPVLPYYEIDDED
jgi:hypothetical protein